MRLPPPPPDTPNVGRRRPFVALVEPEHAIEKHSRKWQAALISAGAAAAAILDLAVRVLT
jgi:hypothetical protein